MNTDTAKGRSRGHFVSRYGKGRYDPIRSSKNGVFGNEINAYRRYDRYPKEGGF